MVIVLPAFRNADSSSFGVDDDAAGCGCPGSYCGG